jgi:hypothetical protein
MHQGGFKLRSILIMPLIALPVLGCTRNKPKAVEIQTANLLVS